jgi:imidazoleglycerol-phosphate dehydratase
MERFGNATVVMDEASVSCDIDLSNRAYLHYQLGLAGQIGSFECELVEEFFKSVVFNTPLTMHLVCNRGRNKHHIAEAAFKAFALSLRRALAHNERMATPSTKGML